MRLERHVGGLTRTRKANYLGARGWEQVGARWRCDRLALEGLKLDRAIQLQLTEDLARGLCRSGWVVTGYSPRGYAQLKEVSGGPACSLPRALRIQARKEKRPVAELTYDLFLAALDETGQ